MAAKTNKINGYHSGDRLFNSQRPKKQFQLPVSRYKDTFRDLLNDNQALLIVGETGSGKTTQIPQWCVEFCSERMHNLGVACTQPRRIAAITVATRVAEEMQVTLGHEVGYSVRFDACANPRTKLKYLTDGMLLRESMLDNTLSSYGIIIIDEAHERTLQTEILFGVLKKVIESRASSLKIVVMSATINIRLFKKYLDCPVLTIEGRQHPVEDMFAEAHQSDLLTSTLITVFQIHRTSDDGDILVFCSGQDEIQSLVMLCKKALKHAPESLQNLTPLPLYAALPSTHQLRVFDRETHINITDQSNGTTLNGNSSSARRVIFSTNVAETSVTIPNIKYVIDTGKVKCRAYCPEVGLESLKVTPISKAQASQRSGRAGRIAPGVCYRLYTSEEYAEMSDHLLPEIKRCNLDSIILQMISIGINNLNNFEFLEKPDDARINSAIVNLMSLKAVKISDMETNQKKLNHLLKGENLMVNNFELTNIGKKMSVFPLSPSMSRIILAANDLRCLDEALTVVSLLYIENLFHIPPNKQNQAEQILEKFRSNEGDVIMLLKVFKAFKKIFVLNRSGVNLWCKEHFIHNKNLKTARLIRKQLSEICKSQGMNSSSCGQDTSILRKALTYGLFNNVATMWNGKYQNKLKNEIYIHPSSCLFKTKPECILYAEILETNKCYMRNCTLIDINWVREISSSNIIKPASGTKQSSHN